jgi:hypothetical protein
MKGFIVKLIPLDSSGIQRNKDFVEKNKGNLFGGGKAVMQPDGSLNCTWSFDGKLSGVMPDTVKHQMLAQFTDSLDKAISKKTNVRYEVVFL